MDGTQYFGGSGQGGGHTAPLPRVRPEPPSTRRRDTLIKGGGLLAVAVVSSLTWWLIRGSGAEQPQPQGTLVESPLTSGEFRYAVVSGPVTSEDCVADSYGDVRDWFDQHQCEQLSRSLYITESEGARALVSVSRVTMPDPRQTRQLKSITDTSGTGNVSDLVRDGTADIPGAPKVASGEYASTVAERDLTIVEANFFEGHTDKALLQRISTDALRLAGTLP
ncbi:hypothetical protein [Amycolatopsis cihanbeyliensis]|uniref:hypothetical protein n=1 Tax=Amycolatopsis cihanbeyliensis TaxID=1128664 RepID=UPI001154804A